MVQWGFPGIIKEWSSEMDDYEKMVIFFCSKRVQGIRLKGNIRWEFPH